MQTTSQNGSRSSQSHSRQTTGQATPCSTLKQIPIPPIMLNIPEEMTGLKPMVHQFKDKRTKVKKGDIYLPPPDEFSSVSE